MYVVVHAVAHADGRRAVSPHDQHTSAGRSLLKAPVQLELAAHALVEAAAIGAACLLVRRGLALRDEAEAACSWHL